MINGGKFYPKGKDRGRELPDVPLDKPTGNIFENFITCMRSRKQEDLIADIETAHYSAVLCHLANVSYRFGKPTPFGKGYEQAGDCPQVKESIKAIEGNLKTVLGIDLSKQTYNLGPKLEFDAATEKFVGNEAANQLITRKYRAPFVVPEQV